MQRRVGAFVLAAVAACGGAATEKPRAMAMEKAPALPWCPEPARHVIRIGDPRAYAGGGGAVQGVVRDRQGALSDVTVVATSPSLEGSASELTDANGDFLIGDLPAGSYEVAFYYGEIKVRQADVAVDDATVTPVTVDLDTTATGGEAIDITQKAPTIEGDVGPGPIDPNDPHGGRLWSQRGITIGQDYTKNVPLASRPATAAPKCRPRPPAAEPTPAPAGPRGRR